MFSAFGSGFTDTPLNSVVGVKGENHPDASADFPRMTALVGASVLGQVR